MSSYVDEINTLISRIQMQDVHLSTISTEILGLISTKHTFYSLKELISSVFCLNVRELLQSQNENSLQYHLYELIRQFSFRGSANELEKDENELHDEGLQLEMNFILVKKIMQPRTNGNAIYHSAMTAFLALHKHRKINELPISFVQDFMSLVLKHPLDGKNDLVKVEQSLFSLWCTLRMNVNEIEGAKWHKEIELYASKMKKKHNIADDCLLITVEMLILLLSIDSSSTSIITIFEKYECPQVFARALAILREKIETFSDILPDEKSIETFDEATIHQLFRDMTELQLLTQLRFMIIRGLMEITWYLTVVRSKTISEMQLLREIVKCGCGGSMLDLTTSDSMSVLLLGRWIKDVQWKEFRLLQDAGAVECAAIRLHKNRLYKYAEELYWTLPIIENVIDRSKNLSKTHAVRRQVRDCLEEEGTGDILDAHKYCILFEVANKVQKLHIKLQLF